jgi:hypothetical protein
VASVVEAAFSFSAPYFKQLGLRLLLLPIIYPKLTAMRPLIIILMFLPFLVSAQADNSKQLYLSAQDKITTQIEGLKCVPNVELSHGYTHTYDCKAADGKVAKQLSLDIHVAPTINNNAYRAYVKHQPEYGEYLLGEFKNGKPYNGFFRASPERVNEWLLFDFYKNGILVSQLYNNLHKTIAGKDNRLNFITLDGECSFVNGKLQNGITITPLHIKKAAGEIVSFMDNFKAAYLMIDVYAENYGEFIKVMPVTDGYMISSLERNSLKVTYTKEGRLLSYYDSDKKLTHNVNMVQAELEETKRIDPKRSYTFFEKNGKLYKEQEKNPAALSDNHDYDLLNSIASTLYTSLPLNTPDFVRIMEQGRHSVGILGYHYLEEGKEYGYVYRKGDKENTYSLDVYQDGKLYKPNQFSIKNKTLEELTAILKTVGSLD